MKKLLETVWGWYSKNTFVRHAVIGALAILITQWAQPLTQWVIKLLGGNQSGQALVVAASAAILRWAQTNIELLIAKFRPPSPTPPVPPPQP